MLFGFNLLGSFRIRKILSFIAFFSFLTLTFRESVSLFYSGFSGFSAFLAIACCFAVVIWFVVDQLVKNYEMERVTSQQKQESLIKEAQNQINIREEVITVVSHDLKNPVTAILLGSDILYKTIKKLGCSESEKLILEKMSLNLKFVAERMNNLINELLEFNRIQSKLYVADKKQNKIDSLIDGTMTMFFPLALKKDIELVKKDRPLDLDYVYCDYEKVHQVLSNLVGNSLKFTPAQGKIIFGVDSDEKNVIFSVKDTGRGIPSDKLDFIFNSYWQVTNEDKNNGLGLGLSICKGIIEAHAGQIWAESVENQGTIIKFTLPQVQ